MALNIKDEKVHALVKEISALTGDSQTAVVRRAVEQLHLRVQAQSGRGEEIRRSGARIGAQLVPLEPGEDPTAFLYDDRGLPA
ncbi:type II toxin-antitoxin system VapB family antitoxin [Gordonia sp. NPDC003585]|uniref:type II toxin-antitoxin system VapB family antitoxin n=1 Tax=unclassified Gordonia (in: high G+C Gram-positive bacteria) TaxID=2657482 RepID=UPI0033A18ABA